MSEPTPSEALAQMDKVLASLSGTGIDRAFHATMINCTAVLQRTIMEHQQLTQENAELRMNCKILTETLAEKRQVEVPPAEETVKGAEVIS